MNRQMTELKLADLHPMPEDSFKVRTDEAFKNLVESVAAYGVIEPVVVRKDGDNSYEIISGQRRAEAAKAAGLDTVPAVVLDLDRDKALLMMVDNNLTQREILISEKAFAYKLKYDVMKRQGNRSDLTSRQVGTKLRTDEMIALDSDDSARQIQRYIRLTELIPELLSLVDEHRIALTPAVELSYLPKEAQKHIYDFYVSDEVTPSYSQSVQFRSLYEKGQLTAEKITEILSAPKPNQRETIKVPVDVVRKLRPKLSVSQMQEFILKACEYYARYLRNRDRGAR